MAGDQVCRLSRVDVDANSSGSADGKGPFLLLLPLFAVTVVFVIVPLAVFVIYSFMTSALFSVALPFTFEAYEAAVRSPLNQSLAWNSIAIGLMTAAITTVIGLAVAYWLRYRAGRLQLPVLFLEIFASYLVRIYAWRTILGRNGLINSGLVEAGLIGEPLEFLLYNWFSVVVALVHIFLPYVVLVLFAAFRPLTPDYLETAQDLGATALARWQRVILPLMAAPTATAFLFVFILSLRFRFCHAAAHWWHRRPASWRADPRPTSRRSGIGQLEQPRAFSCCSSF